MDENILKEFLAQSWEKLIRLDQDLVSLAQNRIDPGSLANLYETIHTLRGNCGFLGLRPTGKLAHAVEQVLDKMQRGELTASAKANSTILESIDVIKAILQTIEATGTEPDRDDSNLIHELNSFVGPEKRERISSVKDKTSCEALEEILLSVSEEVQVADQVIDLVEEESGQSMIQSEEMKTGALLFDPGDGSRMAVPLSLVASYEQLPAKAIQRNGVQEVVQYGDSTIPVEFTFEAPDDGSACTDPQPVIVVAEGDRIAGIMVKEFQGILQEELNIHLKSQRPGILETTMMNGQVTDILDVEYYLSSFILESEEPVETDDWKQHVLVVDDSLFFRKLVSKTLEQKGFHVSQSCSADKAIERLELKEQFDLIVSDIEMPGMSGFEFADWIRQSQKDCSTPLIALSANPEVVEGKQTGFDLILKKFNSQQFLDAVDQLLQTATESGSKTSSSSTILT